MHGGLTNRHQIARPICQRVFYIPVFFNARTLLVEDKRRQVFAKPHIAAIGLQRAQQDIQQRRLARAVRADKADTTAAFDLGRKIMHQRLFAISLIDFVGFSHQLARALAGMQRSLDIALRPAIIAPLLA